MLTNEVGIIIKEFLEVNDVDEKYARNIVDIFKSYKREDLNWKELCIILDKNKGMGKYILQSFEFLYKSNVIKDNYSDFIKNNIEILRNYSTKVSIKKYYFLESNPRNIYSCNVGKKGDQFIYIEMKNQVINDIMHKFIVYLREQKVVISRIIKFIEYFEESLGEINNDITGILDFNIDTLDRQIKFFKNNDYRHQITCLRWFYLYVINNYDQNAKEFFDIKRGIDRNYFMKNNFFDLYIKGHRVVFLNSIDTVSEYDKWIVADNDVREKATLENENTYFPIDFTRIASVELRELVKEWCWKRQVVLKTINDSSNKIIKYIEFCDELENKYTNINIRSINEIERYFSCEYILEFTNQAEGKGMAHNTINGYKMAIRSFIDFIIGKGINISPFIDRYLYCQKVKNNNREKIDDSALDKIFVTIKNMIEDGTVYEKLIGIIIHLQLNTSLRRSSILSLETDCIKDTIKDGEYYIEGKDITSVSSKSKVSNGGVIEVNPSKYVINLIKYAIKITNEIRVNCDDEMAKKIFIKEKNRLNAMGCISEDEVYRKFKDILVNNGIDKHKYTSNNCRNTFMTKIVSYYREKGDFFKAIVATGHKDIKTTLNYVDDDVEEYLEAMYKVCIGDIKLLGQIVNEYEINKNEQRLVLDGCGYCGNEFHKTDRIACLICRDFKVTIDREKYFINAIKKIDRDIMEEKIMHEKEHLVIIKRLLVAYLGAIISYKEGGKNGKE
ncbi:tyrosine-type recombinase/integrase [Clostridium mediterraneense]|uniref:tyrosine-type recombinase/integrase n=1 Tax=Clostridium mediterraneense TaxID=1805472 RepID=UPI000835267A|nr:tyrosine-type recombinase/integrase [Clostridium mediterraneense]